ncbi:MAG: hypothetical protein PUF44_00995 [Bacteroidales bacterium]|nr:hypothetical protein [Bacteroidales bacterium]
MKNITDLEKNSLGTAKNIRLRVLGRTGIIDKKNNPTQKCWVVTGLTPQLYTRKPLKKQIDTALVTGMLGFSGKKLRILAPIGKGHFSGRFAKRPQSAPNGIYL